MKHHVAITIRTTVLLCAFFSGLLLSILTNTAAASGAAFQEPTLAPDDTVPIPEIHPLQLEYWPLIYGRYDVQAFLGDIQSPLRDATVISSEGGAIPFAEALERSAAQYSIHPRILLTLLEISTGKVSGANTRQASLDLKVFASQIENSQRQDETTILLQQLTGAAQHLRAELDRQRRNPLNVADFSLLHVADTQALSRTLLDASPQKEHNDKLNLLKVFSGQFSAWFGPMHIAPRETTTGWADSTTSLPYTNGTYNGAPHAWNTNAATQQSGLDFGSDNDIVLNVANGWFIERGRRSGGVGQYVKLLIDGTDFTIQYWHLKNLSTEIRQKKPGDYIPKGFPIGTQGGTTGVSKKSLKECKELLKYVIDIQNGECLYAAHIHLELRKSRIPGAGTQASWDARQLGPNWVFWVAGNTITRTNGVPYEGTAVASGTPTDIKKIGNYWFVVDENFNTSLGQQSTEKTKFPKTKLDSDNHYQTGCAPSPCPSLPPPEIELPTEKAVLQAGKFDTPLDKIGPIRIIADKHFDPLRKDQFKVHINGRETTVLNATRAGQYNKYELEVKPPTQDSDGIYDLTVQVDNKTVISPKSIRYGDPVGASYQIVLDTSGSMNCSLDALIDCGANTPQPNAKIFEAKATADNFIRLLRSSPPQEYIGLIRFDGNEGVDTSDAQLQPATQDRKEYLSRVVNQLSAKGKTPLYDAIEEAVGSLENSPSPIKVAIVLSDGAQTAGSNDLDRAIQKAKDAGVQICTVRYGAHAVLDVLNRISIETGCTAAQSALEPGELTQAFDTVRQLATGSQIVQTFSGSLQPGETKEYPFVVDELAEAIFKVAWKDVSQKVELELFAPDGTHYTTNELHGSEYISGNTIRAFRISKPASGAWRMRIIGKPSRTTSASGNRQDSGTPFDASLIGDSLLTLRSYANSVVEAGDLVELGVTLASTEPIVDASVLVTVKRPSGSEVIVPLLDDGLHADGFANDGYYSAAFYDTFQTGTYRLEFNVKGVLPNGTAFTRFARRDLEVQGNAGLGLRDITLSKGLNLFGLDGTAPVARDPQAAFLSIQGFYTTVLSYKYPEGGIGHFSDLPPEINTLQEIDPFQGYWIRVTEPVTLQVAGPSLQQNAYIPMHPGWNLVPFLTAATTSLTEALASIEGQYLSVRGFKNGAMSYWPQLPSSMNTLQAMEPGLGYWILMEDNHTLLDYPEFVGGPPLDESEERAQAGPRPTSVSLLNRPQAAEGVSATEQWMDLYSFDVQINGQPAPIGTVISVFDPRGRKVGETQVHTQGWVGVLAVYGDSGFTDEIDGALPGDKLSFQVNGVPATVVESGGKSVRWTKDGDLRQIVISATVEEPDNSLYLPLVNR